MIKNLSLENYRAFEKTNLDFSKINLFLGPNNSGKSSLLSSINLLSQTLQSPDKSIPILLSGNKEELGTFRDVVFNNKVDRAIKIGIGLEAEMKPPFKPRMMQEGYFEVEFKYRPVRREIVIGRTETQVPIGITRLRTERSSTGRHQFFFYDVDGKTIVEKFTHKRGRLINFIPAFMFTRKVAEEIYKSTRKVFYFNFSWSDEIENLEYICPFREFPKRTYLFSGESPFSVGIHGEKAIDLLVMDYLKKGKGKQYIITNISTWLDKCEISKKVDIKTLTDRHYEIRLSQFTTGEKQNLADVGSGCSQVLPILIAGFNLQSGQIFIVEEPEIHLHPKAQAELGSFFYDLSKRNIQTFIETHSEHLVLRIQSHLASGDLDPEDVKVYYVFANKKTNQKDIVEIKLSKNGTFLTEWPEGFFPERLAEVKRTAKASLTRR